MNCVICAIAKNENAYLYEWAKYHLSLGFSMIHIYDNNETSGEAISDVFSGSDIQNKIVIHNVRGKNYVQKKVYQECYTTEEFDWCAFIDVDEFITLSAYNTIQDYLSSLSQWDAIHLNWKCYGDNGKVHYEFGNVIDRFPMPWEDRTSFGYVDKPENMHVKSIIKRDLSIDWTYNGSEWESNPHSPYGVFSLCNSNGEPIANGPFSPVCHEQAYIRHYTTKTIEEYASKVSRQCADCEALFYSFPKFFRVNKVTLRKAYWLKKNHPSVHIWDCIKEHVRFGVVNNGWPLKFLFRSLNK